MYIIKNALISIKRNKGRNILLGMIILVIASSITVTLAIRNSADTLIESYDNKYDIVGNIIADREKMREQLNEGSDMSREEMQAQMQESMDAANQITIAEIDSYADSDYVKSYNYTRDVDMNSNDLKKVESSTQGGMGSMQKPGFNSNEDSGDFKIRGYNSYDAMSDFIEGGYSIVEGEVSNDFDSNNCVINSELASENDIKVGDELTFENPNNEEQSYKLTVTGIFEDSTENESSQMSMFSESANTIITNATVIENISKLDEDLSVRTTPQFILSDELAVDKFAQELKDKGLNEYLTLSTNLDTIENATSSITNIKTFATTFLIVTFIIGGVVLFVINLINIRQRKYEIGVLRTIGMKKSLLTAQFTTELLIVAIISLSLGAGIGKYASVPVSNILLKQEITSSQEQMQDINKNFGRGQGSGDKYGNRMPMDEQGGNKINGVLNIQEFDSMNATVDSTVLVQLFAIGIGLTLISSSACMMSIQRFSPLTILKERS